MENFPPKLNSEISFQSYCYFICCEGVVGNLFQTLLPICAYFKEIALAQAVSVLV